MYIFIKIALMILQSLPAAILNPFFWVVIFIIWLQCKKSAELEKSMFGASKLNPKDKLIHSVFSGILGGLIGSFVVMLIGVSITETGLIYVWPVAIILAILHPHLMCFSYAGGLISLFSLIFGFPKIDVAGLMALVAVLHLVESVLIYFFGNANASPVFIKDERYGVIGGFSLQEFWPVPIILLTVIIGEIPVKSVVQMPDWWPLIRPSKELLKNPNAIFMMLPVVAALGYGDIALTTTPKIRARNSAKNLLAFSALLLFLSVMASRHVLFAYAAAIFAPVAHEMLIVFGRKAEMNNLPVFIPPERGVKILDVINGSPAQKMGLGPGDIIVAVNGREIIGIEDFNDIFNQYPTYIWLEANSIDGEKKEVEFKAFPNGINSIGAIIVPESEPQTFVVVEQKGLLYRIKKFFNK